MRLRSADPFLVSEWALCGRAYGQFLVILHGYEILSRIEARSF
jgi:hypothetical protein